MTKKVYFVFAPIFLYWPVEIVKELNARNEFKVLSGGFIGGPRRYFNILKDELGDLGEELVYTHELEEQWLNKPVSHEKVQLFIDLLGHQIINELVIADRHIGYGFLTGGGIASSKFLDQLKKDKEAYIKYTIGMLDYLYEFLTLKKPDIIYSYAVAGAFTLAIAELSKKLGIKFIKLTHSRVNDRVIIDTDPRDNMERVKEIYQNSAVALSEESMQFAKEYLINFRKKQHQPDYQVLQNSIYLNKTKLSYKAKLFAKRAKGNLDRSNEFFHTSYLGNVSYESKVVKGIKNFWTKKPFFERQSLIDKPFFFYPLHVDPEASTMVISAHQTNQLAVLEAIAKSKPINHIVIVKEHVTMIGRRPDGFYEKINSFPGVYMVNPTEPAPQFIQRAKAVITLTGTAGFEAILLGKPAIFLGNFIYKFLGEGFKLTNDLSKLPGILTNLDCIKCAKDESLIRLLAAIHEVSFAFDGGLIWSGVSKQRVQENPHVVKKFADQFEHFLIK
ncbi:hypothetical protein [Pontibacter litorisediminis]|uniref:capsular polysaccharide export protein, LipB/KpsS family n=1 Tax=Pontibacter litorisediminis TaxID=1846260 RepID=UPI0023EBDEA0|nr:hypothetical protein [Pontibacter litorisediminis]